MIRKSMWAGQFYESNPDRLKKQILSFLPTDVEPSRVIGLVSPHAGYIYSGKVAAETFKRAIIPESIIILGPNHSTIGEPAAIFPQGHWETPLGPVQVNETLGSEIIDRCPVLKPDYAAHSSEHSLEVQLPFIQIIKNDFTFVPICLQLLSLADCEKIGRALAQVIQIHPNEILIVASSDMSHYLSQNNASKIDHLALESFQSLDPEKFYRTIQNHRITMCGYIPATCLLYAARELGATRAWIVKYMTSGDITGDHSKVVGYAGIMVS